MERVQSFAPFMCFSTQCTKTQTKCAWSCKYNCILHWNILTLREKKTAKITFFTCRKSSWFPNGRLLKQENLTWFWFLPQCLAKNRALGSKLNHLFYIFSFIKGTYVNMWKNATISNLPTKKIDSWIEDLKGLISSIIIHKNIPYKQVNGYIP